MVDIYNDAGTESYGCFRHLKDARPTLVDLAAKGVKSVTVSNFRGGNLQRVYRVLMDGRWRLVNVPPLYPAPTPAA